MSRGCWNMYTRKKNKTVETGIVSMCMTQEDTDISHLRFCKVSQSKGISHDNQRFTLMSFVYSQRSIWTSTVPLSVIYQMSFVHVYVLPNLKGHKLKVIMIC